MASMCRDSFSPRRRRQRRQRVVAGADGPGAGGAGPVGGATQPEHHGLVVVAPGGEAVIVGDLGDRRGLAAAGAAATLDVDARQRAVVDGAQVHRALLAPRGVEAQRRPRRTVGTRQQQAEPGVDVRQALLEPRHPLTKHQHLHPRRA